MKVRSKRVVPALPSSGPPTETETIVGVGGSSTAEAHDDRRFALSCAWHAQFHPFTADAHPRAVSRLAVEFGARVAECVGGARADAHPCPHARLEAIEGAAAPTSAKLSDSCAELVLHPTEFTTSAVAHLMVALATRRLRISPALPAPMSFAPPRAQRAAVCAPAAGAGDDVGGDGGGCSVGDESSAAAPGGALATQADRRARPALPAGSAAPMAVRRHLVANQAATLGTQPLEPQLAVPRGAELEPTMPCAVRTDTSARAAAPSAPSDTAAAMAPVENMSDGPILLCRTGGSREHDAHVSAFGASTAVAAAGVPAAPQPTAQTLRTPRAAVPHDATAAGISAGGAQQMACAARPHATLVRSSAPPPPPPSESACAQPQPEQQRLSSTVAQRIGAHVHSVLAAGGLRGMQIDAHSRWPPLAREHASATELEAAVHDAVRRVVGARGAPASGALGMGDAACAAAPTADKVTERGADQLGPADEPRIAELALCIFARLRAARESGVREVDLARELVDAATDCERRARSRRDVAAGTGEDSLGGARALGGDVRAAGANCGAADADAVHDAACALSALSDGGLLLAVGVHEHWCARCVAPTLARAHGPRAQRPVGDCWVRLAARGARRRELARVSLAVGALPTAHGARRAACLASRVAKRPTRLTTHAARARALPLTAPGALPECRRIVAVGHGCGEALRVWCTPVLAHDVPDAATSARAPAGVGGRLHMALQIWRLFDGRPHSALLGALRDALAWQVLTRPGVPEKALQQHFSLFAPVELRAALLALVADGQVEQLQLPPSALALSPFAPAPADARVGGSDGSAAPKARRAYVAAARAQLPFLGIV